MAGFFFNGRYVIEPQIDVVVDIVNSQGTLNGAYTLVLVGSAGDTEPQKLNWWTDIPTALNALTSGRLYNAMTFASQPLKNAQIGPAKIATLRVDEAAQASGQVTYNATTSLDLVSTSWGEPGNQTAWSITSGSTQGYLAQVKNDVIGKTVSQDNLYRASLSIATTSAGVTASVTNTALSVSSGATTIFTVPFAAYSTIQQVVNQINQNSGYTASVLTPNSSDPSTSLDLASSVALTSGGVTLTANVYEVNQWLNSGVQPWLTSSIPSSGASGLPTDGNWHYLSGGTVTAPTNTDWQDAFNVLAQDDTVDFIVTVTSQASIHAMLETHCASMAEKGLWRWGHAGGELGETASQQLTRAQNLNSNFVMLNWPGVQANLLTGANATYEPFYAACMTAGARAAQQLPANIEGQALNVTGLETPTGLYIDELLQGGVAVLKQDKTTGTYVDNAIMTTQNATSEINRQEVSNMIVGLLVRDAKAQVKAQVKGITTPALANLAAQVVQNVAEDYYKAGLLVGQPSGFTGTVAASNAVTINGNVQVGVPLNFVGISFTANTL